MYISAKRLSPAAEDPTTYYIYIPMPADRIFNICSLLFLLHTARSGSVWTGRVKYRYSPTVIPFRDRKWCLVSKCKPMSPYISKCIIASPECVLPLELERDFEGQIIAISVPLDVGPLPIHINTSVGRLK